MLAPYRTGIGSSIRMLVSAFADAGRELWVYWRRRPGLETPELPGNLHGRGIGMPAGYMTAGVPLSLLRDRIQLCHFPAGQLPFLTPTRTVITAYDITWHRFAHVMDPDRAAELRQVYEPGLRKADYIIALSGHTRDDLIDVYDLAPERISVVPLGVDPDMRPASSAEVARVRARYDIDRPFLLYTGTFFENKNIDRLLVCYSRAFADHPDRPQLVLVGPPIPRSEEVLSLANTLEAAEDIRYLGYLPRGDLPGLMTAAVAFVFPSLYEGFGLPPLEAMACGTPVISSTAGGLNETIGDAALRIVPTDEDMLIAALRRIIADESLRRELIAHGHERVKLFNWKRTADLTWSVYERVLGRSCSGATP